MLLASGEASQNGNAAHGSQSGGPNTHQSMVIQTMAIVPMSAVSGHTTNLTGMEYLYGANSSNIFAQIPRNVAFSSVSGGIVAAGSRESMQPQVWLQVFLILLYCYCYSF